MMWYQVISKNIWNFWISQTRYTTLNLLTVWIMNLIRLDDERLSPTSNEDWRLLIQIEKNTTAIFFMKNYH